MDAGMAERLAESMDPKALSSLQNRHSDPAVARAVAAQFGSFLMQGMMQDADGGAMSVAGGTGGAAVSAMFASAMGRYAMSGDKLGLADTIYRSMAAKGAPAPAAAEAKADSSPTPASEASRSPQGAGISLAPYWQDRGHRPIGTSADHLMQPAALGASGKSGPNPDVMAKHEPLTATTAPPPVPSSPSVRMAVTSVAKTSPPADASAPRPLTRARWTGLNLPSQAHVLLPPAEPVPPAAVSAAPAAVSANPAPQATVTPATVTVTPGNDGGNGPVPYGLPWVHHNGDGETGLPKPHHAAATGGGDTSRADAESFVEELGPSIEKASARLGVSPRILLAQAALETGWGHSVVGNNVFGVKAGASWSGTTVTAATHEMTGGHLVAHSGTFRSYANVGQAVDDYAALVSASGRYRSAMGSGDNAAAYAQALAAGGYASDRDYAAKLVAVANSPKMSYAIASLEDASPGQLVSAHG